jgi:hypothetical protein
MVTCQEFEYRISLGLLCFHCSALLSMPEVVIELLRTYDSIA